MSERPAVSDPSGVNPCAEAGHPEHHEGGGCFCGAFGPGGVKRPSSVATTGPWTPAYYSPESPYTRSGRVLNPAPGGWCPTRIENGRPVVHDRFRPYRTEQGCQDHCDRLNERSTE